MTVQRLHKYLDTSENEWEDISLVEQELYRRLWSEIIGSDYNEMYWAIRDIDGNLMLIRERARRIALIDNSYDLQEIVWAIADIESALNRLRRNI